MTAVSAKNERKSRFDMPAVLAWGIVLLVVIGLFSPVFKPDISVLEVPRLAVTLSILAIAGVRYELGFMRNWIGDLILGLVAAIAAYLLLGTIEHHAGQAGLAHGLPQRLVVAAVDAAVADRADGVRVGLVGEQARGQIREIEGAAA